MAEMSRRQQKLQRRREEWAREQALKQVGATSEKLEDAKANALYYIGIPNSFLLVEIYNLLDEYDNLKYKRPTVERLIPDLKKAVMRYENEIHSAFGGATKKKAIFIDVCNLAYGEIEDALSKMKEITRNRLVEAKAKIPELRAQMLTTMVMMLVSEGMFDSVMNYIILKDGIDLRRPMSFLNTKAIADILRPMAEVLMTLKEVSKECNVNFDMMKDPEWVEVKDLLLDTIGQKDFVNAMCKKAAVLNKESIPEFYNRVLKDWEDGKL